MTKETSNEESTGEKKLTLEQQKKQRDTVIQYYKNQQSILKEQLEYEKLLAEIEMHRAKRMEMIIRQAQMSAPPEPEEDSHQNPPPAPESPKERKLKTV